MVPTIILIFVCFALLLYTLLIAPHTDVFEEKVMAVGAPPLVVIGAEGLWGTVLTLTVIYPLAHHVFPGTDCGGTCYEDPVDSIAMILNNQWLTVRTITCCTVLYLLYCTI